MSSRKLSQRVDQEVVEAFQLFDKDHDGKVTKEEIVDLIKSLEGDPKCQHVQVSFVLRQLSSICNPRVMEIF